jgi:hypothetical protein
MAKAGTVAVTDAAAVLVAAASAHSVAKGVTVVTSGAGTELLSGHYDRYQVVISAPVGSSPTYLGSSAVVDSTGWALGPGDDLTVDLPVGESLYARCATGGTATLRVLVMGT